MGDVASKLRYWDKTGRGVEEQMVRRGEDNMREKK